MLHAIWELGHYIRENEKINDVEVLTEQSKLANTKKMLCVVFKKEPNNLVFEEVHIETFDKEKAKKILYRTFGHAQYDAFLTSKLTSPEKLEKRWGKWFSRYLNKFNNVQLLQLVKLAIDKNKDKIYSEISKKYDDILNDGRLKKIEKQNSIITIKIDKKFPGEIPEFVEIFKIISMEDFYFKHKVEARGEGVCSLCFRRKIVFPATPFIFFTVDQAGFSYDFNRINAWKQLPICADCALDLQAGKEYVKNRLSFKLYRYKYFIVPSTINRETLKDIMKEIELYTDKKDYRNGLLNAEEDILEIVKEKEDVLNLIFVFYKIEKQSWKIMRYVEDIPPSRIKQIYDTFRNINKKRLFEEDILQSLLGNKWVGTFIKGAWNNNFQRNNLAGMVGEFFYHKENGRKTFDKSSLDILVDILEGKPIDRKYFIKHLINAIREAYTEENEWYEKILSLKSLYLLTFLLELGLISYLEMKGKDLKEVRNMNEQKEKTKYKEKIDAFFSESSNAFDSPAKKAVFLEGVLTNFLLAVQYKQRGSTPSRKRLYGLKLDRKKVKRLHPYIMEKLRAYDVAYPEIEELIAKYFVEADENGWNLSDDEISYYFALGLNLGKIFKRGDEE